MVFGNLGFGNLVLIHSTYRKESTLTNTHRSQNVWHVHLEKCKKIFKYPLSCPTTVSDQIVGLRECVDSQICRTFWEEYVVDTLGVYCNDYLSLKFASLQYHSCARWASSLLIRWYIRISPLHIKREGLQVIG